MATFLTTTGISYQLEELIRGAQERLVLISPFLKVNNRIRELLTDKDQLKIDTRVVYGKSELSPEESSWLLSTNSIRASYCANLHAKCYLNEQQALLTSMNLYEFSQVNNVEMGLLIDKATDSDLYTAIYNEVLSILRRSEEHRLEPISTTPITQTNAQPRRSFRTKKPKQTHEPPPPTKGFCLRCLQPIDFDPETPYCQRCYKSWSRYKNADYKEKYCHACGLKHRTSRRIPLCTNCSKA